MPSPVHPYSDYGVALRTLRSARAWLGFLLVVCVMMQFVGFSLLYWTDQPYLPRHPQYETRSPLGPSQSDPLMPPNRQLNVHPQWNTTYTMAVPVSQLASLIAVASQVVIVFITLLVILVAQAPGVAQITRSLIWSVLLLFMFLPWQYFAREFPIPGVPYGYKEMLALIAPHVVTGEHVYRYQTFLLYGRFIVWPLVGLFVLLITAEKFRGGIMIAIGHPLQSMIQPRGSSGPLGPQPGPLTMPGKKIAGG